MIARLEFDPHEERYQYLAAIHAVDILGMLHEVRDKLRLFVKYGPMPNAETMDQWYAELCQEIATLPEELT